MGSQKFAHIFNEGEEGTGILGSVLWMVEKVFLNSSMFAGYVFWQDVTAVWNGHDTLRYVLYDISEGTYLKEPVVCSYGSSSGFRVGLSEPAANKRRDNLEQDNMSKMDDGKDS